MICSHYRADSADRRGLQHCQTPSLLRVPAAATCQCHRPIDFPLTSSSSGTGGMAFGGLCAARHQGLYTGSDWHVNTQACRLSVQDERERGGRIVDPRAPLRAQTHPKFGFMTRSTSGTLRPLMSLTSPTDVCERKSKSCPMISTSFHYKPARQSVIGFISA